jgi:hypothetical protein
MSLKEKIKNYANVFLQTDRSEYHYRFPENAIQIAVN